LPMSGTALSERGRQVHPMADVVDEDVDGSVLVEHAVSHLLDLDRVADVDRERRRRPMVSDDLLGDFLSGIAVDIDHEHGGAFGRVQLRGCGSDAGAGTSDQSELARKERLHAVTSRGPYPV